MTAKISVHINYVYEHDDPVGGFGNLHRLIEQLQRVPADVTVDTVGQDSPADAARAAPAAATTRRRGRAATNGAAKTPEDVGEDAGTEDGGLGEEPATAALSDAEAKEKGLATLQAIYGANSDPNSEARKAIRALQKDLAVAKFKDVPDKDGHAFLKRVITLAEAVGHQV